MVDGYGIQHLDMDIYFPPVKLVQMVDGECQAEEVDQDPKKVQHIVAVRTLITVIKVIVI